MHSKNFVSSLFSKVQLVKYAFKIYQRGYLNLSFFLSSSALPAESALASALTKMLKFYVKVFKTLYFLNHRVDLLYIWHDISYWSKILFGITPTPAYDLKVKVTDLEI